MRTTRSMVWRFFLNSVIWPMFIAPLSASEWPFLINPSGYPNIEVRLAQADGLKCLGSVTLQHVLIYDGRVYLSRITMPELETWIIRSGADKFDWRRFGGGHTVFSGSEFKAFGDLWHVAQTLQGSALETVVQNGDGSEINRYEGCYLRQFTRQGSTFDVTYNDGRLAGIDQVNPFSAPILSLSYPLAGNLTNLHFGQLKYELVYNKNCQLVRCLNGLSHKIVVEYTYSAEGLLQKIAMSGHEAVFTWAMPKWVRDEGIMPALNPFVASDGIFDYSTELSRTQTAIHFISLDKKMIGTWTIDHASGRVDIKFEKGDPSTTRS